MRYSQLGKYIGGSPTAGNLSKWADYCSQNSQVNANKSNEGPTNQNVSDPSQVRYHQPGGRDSAFDADKGGLTVRRGGHSFPQLKSGSCSGEGRIELANAQRGKR